MSLNSISSSFKDPQIAFSYSLSVVSNLAATYGKLFHKIAENTHQTLREHVKASMEAFLTRVHILEQLNKLSSHKADIQFFKSHIFS